MVLHACVTFRISFFQPPDTPHLFQLVRWSSCKATSFLYGALRVTSYVWAAKMSNVKSLPFDQKAEHYDHYFRIPNSNTVMAEVTYSAELTTLAEEEVSPNEALGDTRMVNGVGNFKMDVEVRKVRLNQMYEAVSAELGSEKTPSRTMRSLQGLKSQSRKIHHR